MSNLIDESNYVNSNSFYLNNYTDLWKKLSKDNPALAFRFLYLCSYADSDGYLRFGIVKNGVDTSYMTTKDFKEVFNISTGMTTKLKNEFFNSNLIEETNDKKIIVNKKYFARKYSTKLDMQNPIQCYDLGIRSIYKNSQPKEHKRFGVIIILLEHINIYSNVICKNTEEIDYQNVCPLTTSEICKLIEYDPTHFSKIKQCLSKTKVNGNPLLISTFGHGSNLFNVNPAIFNRSKNTNDLSNNRNSAKYRQFVKNVLERDNYECIICNSKMNLEVHHIKSYAKYKELRTDLDNGITLCELHHSAMVLGGFHQTYGTRNNTHEQLQTYIDNKRNELNLPSITIEEIINK